MFLKMTTFQGAVTSGFLIVVLCCLIQTNCDISSNSILRKNDIYAAKTNPAGLIDSLRKQIQIKEKELERAEKVNKNFEKMIQLVNILGQVDTFLTDRTRAMLKKLAVLVEDEDDIILAKSPKHQ